MLALFTWLTTTKLGREVGIGILIFALIIGVYWRGHAAGYASGHVAGGKETFDQLRADMDAERSKVSALLAQYDGQLKMKDQEIAAQQQVVDAQKRQMSLLEAQSADIKRQISQLTDQQVVLDLASRLKVRSVTDMNPTLYPQEIRRADEIVGDYDVVTQKVDSLQKTVTAQGTQIQSLTDKVTITDQKFQAAMNYIDQSDARFKNAYNVFNEIHGRPWWQKALTFGILRNKKITRLSPIVPPNKPPELR